MKIKKIRICFSSLKACSFMKAYTCQVKHMNHSKNVISVNLVPNIKERYSMVRDIFYINVTSNIFRHHHYTYSKRDLTKYLVSYSRGEPYHVFSELLQRRAIPCLYRATPEESHTMSLPSYSRREPYHVFRELLQRRAIPCL